MVVMDLVPYRVRACISCSSLEIEVNARAGDVVCGNCGVVQCERLLDSRDEVRIYEDDGGKKSSRTSGFADSFGNDSLVLVGGLEKDRQSFDRAQRAMANRKVNTVLSHLMVINGLSSRMNLTPSIQAKAAELFQRVLMENVVRTKHKSCVAAACIYLACRLEGFPRLLDEVCIGCEEDINRMTKFQSKISAHLALPLSRITCADIVNRLGKKLRLSHPVVECAYEMCRKSVEYDLCESATPQAIAAAALLWANLVDQLRRTSVVSLTREDVRAVVQQCYSGEKAVDTVYKAFRRCIHMLLPDDWTISNDLLNAAPGGLESFPLQKDIDSKATSSTNVGQDGRTPQYIIRTPKGLKRMQSSAPTEDEPESLAKAPRLCM